eukprot:TRINITY_DN3697_c0_g1_i1.p1 TRINITY_DN3697_c0_g1~~TRINITY_DN3697_c0_g1_i1.p1  ORF type:complete len:387 (+),score=107.39 TRINITY_DN3697_c0_g1_i1:60-1220(+)
MNPNIELSEEQKILCQKFLDSSSHCIAMDPLSSIDSISSSLLSPEETVVAFDFDQTLKMAPKKGINEKATIRGGDGTKEFMDRLLKENYPTIIITAATPNEQATETLRKEVVKIGFGKHFGVEDFDNVKLIERLEKMGENEELTEPQILTKLVLLLSLLSNKISEELGRVGRSNILIKDDRIGFRLRKGEDWGATLFLMVNEKNPRLCPVRCLKRYLVLTEDYKFEEAEYGKEIDRLFLSHEKDQRKPLLENQILDIVKVFLKESDYDLEYSSVRSFYEKRAKEISHEGAKFYSCNNLLLSKYNKAEALIWWLKEKKMNPKRIIFVDDNSDNAFSVYMHICNTTQISIHSYWYTPPSYGKDELSDQEMRKMFLYISQNKQLSLKQN